MKKANKKSCIFCGHLLKRVRRKKQTKYVCVNSECANADIKQQKRSESILNLADLSRGVGISFESNSAQNVSPKLSEADIAIETARKTVRTLLETDDESVNALKLMLVLIAKELEVYEIVDVLVEKFGFSHIFK